VVTFAMPRISLVLGEESAPRGEVSAPRLRDASWLAGVFAAMSVGCANGAADQVTQPVVVGMTSTTTAIYSDGNVSIFQVQIPAPLPVRKMTAADVTAAGPAPAKTPYPRGVFLRAEDESVEVRFTLTNLDDTAHDIWLLVDPWNEFVRWRPGVTVVDDETTLPNFGYDQLFTVLAKQRLEGTLTPDDMHEVAIKLASVENMIANQPPPSADSSAGAGGGIDPTAIANNIFNPQNRSNSNDPLYTPWIPPVVAGLVGFDLGLRTGEPANIAVEITMEVQDLHGDRFVLQDNASQAQMGMPTEVLSPPGARF
jgi:hypothetical protein